MHEESQDQPGFMLINNVCLSSKPPALRGEDNYLDLILGKLEKSLEMARERGLTPLICGSFALKTLDIQVFKRLYPILSQYPDLVIIASGNMLDKRTGEVKDKTILDIIKSMNLCDVLAPADEEFVEFFTDQGMLRLSVGEKGDFAISLIDEDDKPWNLVGTDKDLPVLSRLTSHQASQAASVLVVTGSTIETVDIETFPPAFADTRFDVNRPDDDFSSELVVQLQQMFDRANEEETEVAMDDQLKAIFAQQKTSEPAKRVVFQIIKDVEDQPV